MIFVKKSNREGTERLLLFTVMPFTATNGYKENNMLCAIVEMK